MNDKKTLITMVVLLVLSLPCAIYGIYMNATKEDVVIDDNPNKEFIFNNKVYFYNNGTLIDTYQCESKCSEVTTIIDDQQYSTHYYEFGELENPRMLPNDYALFKEGDKLLLYNYDVDKALLTYDAIKTYNVKHTEDVAIVRSGTLYGVISLSQMTPLISYTYDYIAIPNRVHDGVLDTSRFIARQGSYWYVLEKDGTSKHDRIRETIVDFNNNYLIVYNLGVYRILDYNLQEYLTDQHKSDVYCVGNYVLVIDNNILSLYQDINNGVIKTVELAGYEDITFNYVESKIEIYLDHNLYQTIDLTTIV